MSTARVLPLTVWVAADDVQRALGCSRSLAYQHLARAAGRETGARGLLRVPIATWEAYAAATFGAANDPPPEPPRFVQPSTGPLRLVASNGKSKHSGPVRITQPRRRR